MPLPPSSKYLQRPDVPIDEIERDAITARLNAAYAEGRLSHDGYVALMEILYAATTLGDLVPVIEQLPPAPVLVPDIVKQTGPQAGVLAPTRDMTAITLVGGLCLLASVLALIAVIGLVFW